MMRLNSLRNLGFYLLCAVMLNGCFMMGPDYIRPELPLPETWLEARNQQLKPGNYKNWWTLFNDPILNQLVDSAYTQNLNLQIAAVRILEARAQLGIARGTLFPQQQNLNSSLLYNKLSENSPNFEASDDPTFATFSFGFDALWEVDIWGRFRRSIQAAQATLDMSLANYDDVLVTLTAEVAMHYVQMRTFQQRLRLAKENIVIQQQSFNITKALYENELSTELDMQQAKSLLYGTKALIATLKTGLRHSMNSLNILLGTLPGNLNYLLSTDNSIPIAPAQTIIGIPADMLRRRPDVRREEFQAISQSALIGVAKADLLPRFSLRGAIGLNSSNANSVDLTAIFDLKSLAASVGPSVTWPVLNYGRFQQSLLRYQQTVLRAVKEVEDAMVGFLNAKQQVEDLRESVTASSRAVKLSLIQYQDGIEDYNRVLNSQQVLVKLQERLVNSQGKVAKHLIAMYKALGGGWEIRQDKDLIPEHIKTQMLKRSDWEEYREIKVQK